MDFLGKLKDFGSKAKSVCNWLAGSRFAPDKADLKACKFPSSNGDYGTCIYLGHYDGNTVLGISGEVADKITTLDPSDFTDDIVGDVKTLILPSTMKKEHFESDALEAISKMSSLEHIGIVDDSSNSLIDCYIAKSKKKENKLELFDQEEGEKYDGHKIKIEAFDSSVNEAFIHDFIRECFRRYNEARH